MTLSSFRPGERRAFGHGKVILLGEHAVVYGQPALGAGLSLGVWAEASPGTGELTAPDWNLRVRAGEDSALARAFTAILARLQVHDVDVRLGGDLPTRAGLGSSAAIGIAVAGAVMAMRQEDRGGGGDGGEGVGEGDRAGAGGGTADLALAAAADAEVVFHGTPSGIDLAAASSGQVGRFEKSVGWQPIDVLQPMTLCVGLSGVPRDTRVQVDAVRRLRDRTPQVDAVMAAMGAVAGAGQRALEQGNVDELGRLFDVAHGLLAALRVSSPELDTLVHLARRAGAVGAKLTGAGGGGAVIALAPGHERDVLAQWSAAGFKGFLAQIGSARRDASLDPAGIDTPLPRGTVTAAPMAGETARASGTAPAAGARREAAR